MNDKFEKGVFLGTLAILILFIFSILYAKGIKRIDLPECLPYDKAYELPKVEKVDSGLYSVYAVAQMWLFQPAQIIVPAGSTVDFYLTSKDVVHGFNIFEKNVNMMAVYGGVNKTTVHFDEPGIYKITCHEYCGTGHQNMQAEIIVSNPPVK